RLDRETGKPAGGYKLHRTRRYDGKIDAPFLVRLNCLHHHALTVRGSSAQRFWKRRDPTEHRICPLRCFHGENESATDDSRLAYIERPHGLVHAQAVSDVLLVFGAWLQPAHRASWREEITCDIGRAYDLHTLPLEHRKEGPQQRIVALDRR